MIKKGIYILNTLILLLTIVSCIAAYLNPETFELYSILSLTFPIWVLLNIGMILYWLIIEPKYAAVSFVALLLCCNSVLNLIHWSPSKSSSDKDALKLMSYNMGGSYYLSKAEKERRNKWMPRDIFNNDIDIIAFQESGSSANFKDEFLAYDQHHFSESGTSIYSKLPIIKKGKIDFGTKTNSAIWVDVEIDNNVVRIYSVHLKSNKISSSDIEALNDLNRNYEQNLKETKSVLRKYLNESKTRSKQLKQLLKDIDNSPYPVIVCGDFNEPPYSYVYKKMTKNLNDSFRESGRGFAATFAGKIPFLRIDYVFIDPSIQTVKHKVGKQKWSDHYPVLVDLEI